MAKIKKGDLVVVISGRDKGKQGRVLEVLAGVRSASSSRASSACRST